MLQRAKRDSGIVFVRTVANLTPTLLERLDAEAQKRTMNRSLLIRLACEKYLQETEPRKEETLV